MKKKNEIMLETFLPAAVYASNKSQKMWGRVISLGREHIKFISKFVMDSSEIIVLEFEVGALSFSPRLKIKSARKDKDGYFVYRAFYADGGEKKEFMSLVSELVSSRTK